MLVSLEDISEDLYAMSFRDKTTPRAAFKDKNPMLQSNMTRLQLRTAS